MKNSGVDCQQERSLVTQRLTIFLIVSSILFLGFVGLVGKSNNLFLTIICGGGLFSSLMMLLHSCHVKRKLNKICTYERKDEGYSWWLKGRYMGMYASAIFGVLWALSIVAIWRHWLVLD